MRVLKRKRIYRVHIVTVIILIVLCASVGILHTKKLTVQHRRESWLNVINWEVQDRAYTGKI